MKEDLVRFQRDLVSALLDEAETAVQRRLSCDFESNPDFWWEQKALAYALYAAARTVRGLPAGELATADDLQSRATDAFTEKNPGADESWGPRAQADAHAEVRFFIRSFGDRSARS